MRNNYRRSSVLFLDQTWLWWKNYREVEKNNEEQRKNSGNPKCGSTVERCRDLPALRSRGGRRRFSGQVRVMQRPRLTKTRRAAAAAELERQRSNERKKMTEGGEWEDLGRAYL